MKNYILPLRKKIETMLVQCHKHNALACIAVLHKSYSVGKFLSAIQVSARVWLVRIESVRLRHRIMATVANHHLERQTRNNFRAPTCWPLLL